jgi:lipopolysaccharide transport system ATP-binding protein
MARIEAEGLAIEYPLYHHNARSLKRRLMGATPRRLKEDQSHRVVVAALRNLTFTIERGERVALVGPNGAGKSTLLRTVAGIYEPVAGRLRVEGEIGSLIDPGAGMEALATGRENIVLRGLYRGMSEAEAEAMAEEVVAFADLGEFIDVQIRGYSAGMQVRLAFALATAMMPEILLMDEWFLAGDAEFMARAEERLKQLVTGADILMLATHDMAVVRRWCTRAIRIEGGVILQDGPVDEVLGPA